MNHDKDCVLNAYRLAVNQARLSLGYEGFSVVMHPNTLDTYERCATIVLAEPSDQLPMEFFGDMGRRWVAGYPIRTSLLVEPGLLIFEKDDLRMTARVPAFP